MEIPFTTLHSVTGQSARRAVLVQKWRNTNDDSPFEMMPFPHAVELQDADGETVAMLWSGDDGVELICERGYTAVAELVREESPFRLRLRVIRTPDGATAARPRPAPRA